MISVQNYIREEITVISVNKSTLMVRMIKMKPAGFSVMVAKNGYFFIIEKFRITLIVRQNIEILIFVMKLITSLITVSLV